MHHTRKFILSKSKLSNTSISILLNLLTISGNLNPSPGTDCFYSQYVLLGGPNEVVLVMSWLLMDGLYFPISVPEEIVLSLIASQDFHDSSITSCMCPCCPIDGSLAWQFFIITVNPLSFYSHWGRSSFILSLISSFIYYPCM